MGLLIGFGIAILCDFAPVMFLLIFHYKNFNKSVKANVLDVTMDMDDESVDSHIVVHLTMDNEESVAGTKYRQNSKKYLVDERSSVNLEEDD